jgi:hypothetical protein
LEATPFTLVIPLAGSGASKPLSGGLNRQLTHRRDPHINGNGTQPEAKPK